MPRFLSASMASLGLVVLAGCQNYFAYAPRPAVTMLQPDPKAPAEQARLLVTATAIRWPPGQKISIVELVVRVENLGGPAITFDPQKVAVLDSRLNALAGPTGEVQPMTIAPGQSGLRRLEFALPPNHSPEDGKYATLNVRVTLSSNGHDYPHDMAFQQVYYGGYGYYYAPPYPYYW
jgi:hypothetical protein